jgi:hypothetical protein
MLDIKSHAKTMPGTIPVRLQIVIESIGESISYIHKPDKSIEISSKQPETVIITGKCTYYVPDYVKEIMYSVSSGLGKAICISDTIIHKCTISDLSLSKDLLLSTLDTIIEIIEAKQPEIK